MERKGARGTAQIGGVAILWVGAILLIALVCIAFGQAMRFGLINYDDPAYGPANLVVRHGLTWHGILWAFKDYQTTSNWHPVTWLSLMLDSSLFGPRAWGYHLTNLLLHSANAVLLFLVFFALTGATWRSLAVAALFAVHPVHVESVVWISERKDVLSTLFLFVSILCYVYYTRRYPGHGRKRGVLYYLALCSLAVGLMAKPMLVTAPFLLLLLDYWPLQRLHKESFIRLLDEKIPFFALSLIFSVTTWLTQSAAGSTEPLQYLTLDQRLGNALVSYVRYIGKFFVPINLSVLYPHPGNWPLVEVVLSALFLVGITILFLVLWRQHYLVVGWLWFVGMLVPVIGLVQVGNQAMADRYTYVPYVGLSLIVVWLLHSLAHQSPLRIAAAATIVIAGILSCAALTARQVGVWSSSETLFRHAIAVTSNNSGAYLMLGKTLHQQRRYEEAAMEYKTCLRLRPSTAVALNNLGSVRADQHKLKEAINLYRAALKLEPGYSQPRLNLARALVQQGHLQEAIQECRRGLTIQPTNAELHGLLGALLSKTGDADHAVESLSWATRLKPDWADAQADLAAALVKAHRVPDAIAAWRRAISLNADAADYHTQLAILLFGQGKVDDAIAEFEIALRLQPGSDDARYNLDAARRAKKMAR
jgi:tetratricopeptide (TPR) repeat protein